MDVVLTPTYIANFIFLVIGFFTFVKLISSEVYLSNHRLLPCIVAVMVIHGFYICVMPLLGADYDVRILEVFSDMCATCIVYLMLFYYMQVKRPKYHKIITGLSAASMIIVCLMEFFDSRFALDINAKLDTITVVLIVVVSLYTFISSETSRLFARDDKQAGNMMYLAYATALVGFFLQGFFYDERWIVCFAFALNCIMYYYIAATNRIEDTAVIVSNAVFQVVDTPLIIVNPQFYIVEVNESCAKLFPGGAGGEFAFENGEYRSKFILGQNMVAHNESGKEFYAGGKWYWVTWTNVDSKHGTKGYIFQCTDVTNQHEEVLQAKEQTAEKSQFLAHMSHELRSPLHAIIGVSDILLGKHDISTKNRNLVQHIKKASDGLLDLVDSILDFSKLEAGKFTFSEKKYNISELFEELTYNNIVNLQSKPVDFSFSITSDYPKEVLGDKLRVREVFQNLLSNAVKFTDSGSIHAEVSFVKEWDMYHIFFTVEDTGAGISPELIQDAFSEYVSMSGEIEGTGLGLSITKQLIELMGGNVTVESDGVTGTKFVGDFYQKSCETLLLPPALLTRKNVLNVNGNTAISDMRPEWIYPGAHVLVADDMKINQEIMLQLLLPWRCHVHCVSDGMAAVQAAKEQQYDLILLDQMMSPVGGPEAAEKIRMFSDVPIVLVTANTEDNVQSLLEDHGINDFIGKPIHVPSIARIMDQYMPADIREKNLEETAVVNQRRHDMQNIAVYKPTLEAFVKEMQPLLLHLTDYVRDDKNLFKIKVHGIKGVSRQIGRESFADQAEIMEMAAKAEHWQYIEKHIEEFLNALCDVVEDVTMELTQMAPEDGAFPFDLVEEKKKDEPIDDEKVREVFGQLLEAFDAYDISAIEQGINYLDGMALSKEHYKIYSQIIDAYDELEYEKGSEVLSEYLN